MTDLPKGASPFLPTVPLLEYWKPVVGFSGYQVSNVGRIWSEKQSGRFLTPRLDRRRYPYVSLHRYGNQTFKFVHALVAEAFVGERPEGHEVNHCNGWKLKNWASNLEFLSQADNIRHGFRTGLYDFSYRAKLTEQDVNHILLNPKGLAGAALARQFSVSESLICRIRKGTRRGYAKSP